MLNLETLPKEEYVRRRNLAYHCRHKVKEQTILHMTNGFSRAGHAVIKSTVVCDVCGAIKKYVTDVKSGKRKIEEGV